MNGNKLPNNSKESVTNEVFYLDVSKQFSTTDNASIPWVDLTYTGGPFKGEATACSGGKNNDIIFILGGYYSYYDNQFDVNQFDTSTQQWIKKQPGTPTYRQDISCAKFSSGLIAIFSGLSVDGINDLWIFDTLALSWSLINAVNAPPQRFGYCAITLPDENILYIGGVSGVYSSSISSYTPMNIVAPDRRIIIFGGCTKGGGPLGDLGGARGDLWILDTVVFQWSIGKILNPIEGLVLCGHTAVLVEIYMIVAFGSFMNGSLSSKLFMLDVNQKNSYRWVNEFTTYVSFPSNAAISDFKISSLTIGAITGCVIFLVIFIIAAIGYKIYKNLRHKRLQEAVQNMSI
ncbi:42726_t:CDS:2 [Gigaspora margarita]|uniref:42726_t:CDS:1 n=1 Tax=Gigaspora margarita TaxID=4874 RepID=A0ABN7UPS4_GIGMA|nr:42726_t:CDS:2 [Gigaspora margarita]